MELTKWQTRQTNNFLESIGVAYIDIRFEMIDHIATEIEENVDDFDAFFEHKGFQTPFLKYMLSKKDMLREEYKKIIKRKFWSNFKTIIINIGKETIKTKNLLLLTTLIISTYSLSLFDIKNALVCLFISSAIVYSYNIYLHHKAFKKYANIKLIQSYSIFLAFASYFPLYINNPLLLSDKTNVEAWSLYVHVVFIFIVFLLGKTFINQKDKLDIKYNYLIQ